MEDGGPAVSEGSLEGGGSTKEVPTQPGGWRRIDHGNFKVKRTCFQKSVLCFIYDSPKQTVSIL